MHVTIERLTPALLEDYMDYFDHVAFRDHPQWAGCYCVHYHWDDRMEAAYRAREADATVPFNRAYAVRFVRDGTMQGYLAYVDGRVAGWCNANDRTAYGGLSQDRWPALWLGEDAPAQRVKSIVCFSVAAALRNQGIATRLLACVSADARAEGYAALEAYPRVRDDAHGNHHGPLSLYERDGFTVHKRLEGTLVVRKALQE